MPQVVSRCGRVNIHPTRSSPSSSDLKSSTNCTWIPRGERSLCICLPRAIIEKLGIRVRLGLFFAVARSRNGRPGIDLPGRGGSAFPVESESIDRRKLHSARIGECLAVIAERRGHVPLVLHGECVEAGIVEYVEYAPAEFKRIRLGTRNLPLLGEIHVGGEIAISPNCVSRAALSRIREIEACTCLRGIFEDVRNAVRDRRSGCDWFSGQVRPAHFI